MGSEAAGEMEHNMSFQQARESLQGRYTKMIQARDKVKALQSAVPKAERLAYSAEDGGLDYKREVENTRKKMLNNQKGINFVAPIRQRGRQQIIEGTAKQQEIEDSACKHNRETHHSAVEAEKEKGLHDFSHLQKTPNVVQPFPHESLSTDPANKHAGQVDSLTARPSPIGDSVPYSPNQGTKSPLPGKTSTLERPNGLPVLFPTVLPPLSPIEHPTQLPILRADEIPIFTGRSSPDTNSNKSNESVTSKASSIAHFQSNRQAKYLLPDFKTQNLFALDLRRFEGTKSIQSDFDALRDGEMKPLRELRAGLDGTDDSDTSFEEDEGNQSTHRAENFGSGRSIRSSTLRSASSASATPTRACDSPAPGPITRDTSFSTRPTREAARLASAAITASRKKGRGRGGPGASAPAAPPTASAPPPPPPPPPRHPPGDASGHNKTWGFTTGPNGPWIEPPVITDPKITSPAVRKNLKKDVKEAMVRLEEEDPDYDSHAPAVVRNQESVYKLRVWGAIGQRPTSNVRGAVDWEFIQKRRLGVAVKEAMRQAEEEEKAEEMEQQRNARNEETVEKKKDQDKRLFGSEDDVETKDISDWEESVATGAGLDTDYVEDESDDDGDATLVGEFSNDDDANSLHGAELENIPRSFNEDSTQHLAAQNEAQLVDSLLPSTFSAGNRDTTNDDDQECDESHRRPEIPFSVRVDFNLRRVAEREACNLDIENMPTAPQTASSPLETFPSTDYTEEPTNASPRLPKFATNLLSNMTTITARDSAHATTGGGRLLRVQDFEYHNLVASGQIGGAAKNARRGLHLVHMFLEGVRPAQSNTMRV